MDKRYDIGIIGAGLAGLSLAIYMAREGSKVVLFEKNIFPFHKLCGEYLSLESVPFLEHLGVNFGEIRPAEINELLVTNTSGKSLRNDLAQGGIGVSRYTLDHILYEKAKDTGVKVLENTLVTKYESDNGQKIVTTKKGEYYVNILVSAYGKKSNLIPKPKSKRANQYIGIKYHVKLQDYPPNLISMHNFPDGYCGVCRLEGDWVSLCYLSHTNNLKNAGNKIKALEERVLFKNKAIRTVFEEAEFLYEKPIAVSNINFNRKNLLANGVFNSGDAAGLITPLCGNGMSMALHSSYMLALLLIKYFQQEIDITELESSYVSKWKKQFSTRMLVGRSIQKLFRYEKTADFGIGILRSIPVLNRKLISLTHGKPFFNTN